MKTLTIDINGYIEGYYGRLLKWSERHAIVKKLHDIQFNSYFYCPKEDPKHRYNWRESYTIKWTKAFNNFCKIAKKHNIQVLYGIAPGLDYNFKKCSNDFKVLFQKIKTLKINGASRIVLMFDDIPRKNYIFDNISKTEGALHGELANSIAKELEEDIFVVPRVYSDELFDNDSDYLSDFCKTVNKNISIFYCGKKIIADTNSLRELASIKKTTSNNLIFWDNLYANDYCPQKIFLCPWLGRNNVNNVMINPTGLIQTDLMLLDLIGLTKHNQDNLKNWENILKKYNVPKQFQNISKYFYPINYLEKEIINKKIIYDEIECLDFLLWKWKTPLAREWYQYLFILKQDLNLLHNNLEKERIKKNFSIPLNEFINKKLGEI
mgnify:CR=1 FL=1